MSTDYQSRFDFLKSDTSIEKNLDFLLSVLRPVTIIKAILVVALSTDRIMTGILVAGYIVHIILSPRLVFLLKRNVSSFVMFVSLAFFCAITMVSGPAAPSWLLFLSPLIPSIFLTPQKRLKVFLVVITNLTAAVVIFFSGRTIAAFLSQVGALTIFSLLFFRAYLYLDTQNKIIEKERERSDLLLHNILPHKVVERLKQAEPVTAVRFDMASILFADLVGFTTLSKHRKPEELISMLNKIFSEFDELVEQRSLEKIKTIGDAYMVAGGVPEMDAKHLSKIAELALDMRERLHGLSETLGESIQCRIGVHAGPLVGGVIGFKKFSYDVWGDTVNVASRLESHGVPGRIQVSEQLYEALKDHYLFEERGLVSLKGRGDVKTYFLHERLQPVNVPN